MRNMDVERGAGGLDFEIWYFPINFLVNNVLSWQNKLITVGHSAVAKSVCNPVISPASMSCTTFCIVCFINLRSAKCVCSYYGLRVCYKQIN